MPGRKLGIVFVLIALFLTAIGLRLGQHPVEAGLAASPSEVAGPVLPPIGHRPAAVDGFSINVIKN